MRSKCTLECDLCSKKFNPFYSNKKFTWEYDFRGIERIFCQKCSNAEKKRLSGVRGLTKQKALVSQDPPKNTSFVKIDRSYRAA